MSSREPHWPVGPTASAGSRRSTRHSYQPHNKWMKMTTITSSSSTTTTTTNPRYVDAGVHFHLRFHRRSSGPSFQQRRRLGQQTSGPSSSPAATIIVIIKVTGWGRRAGGVVCGWVEGGGGEGLPAGRTIFRLTCPCNNKNKTRQHWPKGNSGTRHVCRPYHQPPPPLPLFLSAFFLFLFSGF